MGDDTSSGDRYRECESCGEEKRIVQGGCCRECMERILAEGIFL